MQLFFEYLDKQELYGVQGLFYTCLGYDGKGSGLDFERQILYIYPLCLLGCLIQWIAIKVELFKQIYKVTGSFEDYDTGLPVLHHTKCCAKDEIFLHKRMSFLYEQE